MNKNRILEYYKNVVPVNYTTCFIEEQLNSLEDIRRNDVISTKEEAMFLNIILSALKYYLEASPEGYGEDIIGITDRLEAIYSISGIFEGLLDMSE